MKYGVEYPHSHLHGPCHHILSNLFLWSGSILCLWPSTDLLSSLSTGTVRADGQGSCSTSEKAEGKSKMGLEWYGWSQPPSPPSLLTQEVEWEQRLGSAAHAGPWHSSLVVYFFVYSPNPPESATATGERTMQRLFEKGGSGQGCEVWNSWFSFLQSQAKCAVSSCRALPQLPSTAICLKHI